MTGLELEGGTSKPPSVPSASDLVGLNHQPEAAGGGGGSSAGEGSGVTAGTVHADAAGAAPAKTFADGAQVRERGSFWVCRLEEIGGCNGQDSCAGWITRYHQ